MLNTLKEDIFSNRKTTKYILFITLIQRFLSKLRIQCTILLLSSLVFSCSQEKHTFVSKNFHNTTAHYNAYFLAREKMKEVDAQIIKTNVDDYNKILPIYYPISSGTVSSIKAPLEEVIKKASLIHEKHKNSRWLDDAYIIIGKSYFYRHEYPTALAFFKFVNSNSKEDIGRHAALAFLMRTYIDSADYSSAKAVSDYVDKKQKEGEVLSKENSKDFYLTEAYYHQKLEGFNEMLSNLEKAAPLLKTREEKARINFILGQLYQTQNNDSAAYKRYKSTIKRNPAYDLLFHAKLYSTQVSKISKATNRRKIDRYFKKLLRDKKNIEYKDKIYYEIARSELKQGNYEKAIANLEKSVQVSTKNTSQKGLSYLQLGEIYYEKEQFDISKLYYDSTLTVWNTQDKRYKSIELRHKILAEFVRHKQTVQREDSLQRLAKMSKEELNNHIDNVIALEKEQELKKQTSLNNALKDKGNSSPDTDLDADNETSDFPLTNSLAIASGKTDFIKIWGNRKLEDNWRISQKESFDFSEDKITDSNIDDKKDTLNKNTVPEQVINKDLYYKNIPFKKEQLDSSNKRIEYAIYNIGKIYNQKLDEPNNSIKTFEEFIKRFPESEYKAEVYYFLYLIYTNKNETTSADNYKNKLLSDFPSSLYTKLLTNPNYLTDNKIANQQAHAKYKEAYELYKSESYKSSELLINELRIQFPDNDIEDKLSFLQILIIGQTSNAIAYQNKLQEFITNFADSPLLPKAKELLTASNEFINKKTEKGDSIGITDAKYSTELNKPHYLISVLPNSLPSKKTIAEFKQYNKNVNKELIIESKLFSDSTYIIIIKGFEEKFPAQVYINNLKDSKSFYNKNGYLKYPVFIITNHNYQLFLDSKNLDGYLKFYTEKY